MYKPVFQDVIEMLLVAGSVGVSVELETDDTVRTGTISLLSIATRTEVFIFDIHEIGPDVFRWEGILISLVLRMFINVE